MNTKALVFAALLFGATPAMATSVPLAGCGINDLGCFEALATYTGSDHEATLTLAITNTSSDGYLTALAFNNPGSNAGSPAISSVVLSSAPTNFNLLGGPLFDDGINASPFGQFDIGAASSAGGNLSWQGSGNPSAGLAAGQSGIFSFSLTGNLLGLTITDFFGSLLNPSAGELSSGPGIGSYGAQVLAVRFRGFACEPECEGSDKAYGQVVPIPPALALFLTGLGFVAWFGRRRKPATAAA